MVRDYDAMISYTRQQGAAVAQRVLDLLRGEGFAIWQDRTHMRGGEDFWRQIEAAIARARHLVMVVTPDAFEGDRRVLREEWLTARRRGCHIVPVHEAGAFRFSSGNTPAWLRKLDCYNLDDANHCARPASALRSSTETLCIPHNVDYPRRFVARAEEMRGIADALLDRADGVRVAPTVALSGAGGFGKTTLARAVCFDDDVLARYTDGVLWLTVGEGTRTVEHMLTALLAQLGVAARAGNADSLSGEWKEALRTRACLVVLDDVWQTADACALVVDDTPSGFLLTTRLPRVASAVDARDCAVAAMTPAQAQAVLADALGPDGDPARLAALAARAGCWPVLLGLIAGKLRHALRRPGAAASCVLDEVEEDLRDLSLTAFDAPAARRRAEAVAATMEASLRYLGEPDPHAAERYRQLAVFPDDVALPLAVLQDLWGVAQASARRLAEQFDDAGLAIFDRRRGLVVHDVFLAYLRSRCTPDALRALHVRLLSAWPAIHALPHDHAWRWFGWHCMQAGLAARLDAALLDLDWLTARLARTDLAGLLADCRRSAHDAAPLLDEVLEKSADVLLAAPGQLAAQLFGRTRPARFAALDPLLDQARRHLAGRPLQPVSRSLHPIGSPLRRTLRGHRATVNHARVLADGRLLSWSTDVRLWSAAGDPLAVLRGHADWIVDVQELADGRLLSCSQDHTLRLWSAAGDPLSVLHGHHGWVTGMQELADGRLLSWSHDSTLRMWSGTGTLLAVLHGHARGVAGAAVLEDGHVLSWSPDRTLRLWSADGAFLAVLVGHGGAGIGALALADGRVLSWSNDGDLRLWSGAGRPLAVLAGHTHWVMGALALADGRLLSWSRDATLRLWSAAGAPLAVLRGHEDGVLGACALADGRMLSWSRDATLRLWSSAGTELAVLYGHDDSVAGALASADGRILSWGADSTLRMWSGAGAPLGVLHGHESWVGGALALVDGRLLSWSADRTLRLWSAAVEPPLPRGGHTQGIVGALARADGSALSWSWDGTLRLWSDEGVAQAALRGHEGGVKGALALRDGRLLSWSYDGTLRLWSYDGVALDVLGGHAGSVNGALELADGRLLSWAGDATLRFWSAAGQPLAMLRQESDIGGALALPDGRLLSWPAGVVSLPDADGPDDHSLHIWSGMGKPSTRLYGHGEPVAGARALPGGGLLSWSLDKTLRLWSAQDEAGPVLRGHDAPVRDACMVPGGRILSWSLDATLRLWSATGAPLAVLRGHGQRVNGAAVLGGERLLSWSADDTLRLWSPDGEPLAVLHGHDGRIAGARALADGRILSRSDDKTLRLWSRDGAPRDVLYVDAAVTVAQPCAGGQLFVGDALGGVHIVALSHPGKRP